MSSSRRKSESGLVEKFTIFRCPAGGHTFAQRITNGPEIDVHTAISERRSKSVRNLLTRCEANECARRTHHIDILPAMLAVVTISWRTDVKRDIVRKYMAWTVAKFHPPLLGQNGFRFRHLPRLIRCGVFSTAVDVSVMVCVYGTLLILDANPKSVLFSCMYGGLSSFHLRNETSCAAVRPLVRTDASNCK